MTEEIFNTYFAIGFASAAGVLALCLTAAMLCLGGYAILDLLANLIGWVVRKCGGGPNPQIEPFHAPHLRSKRREGGPEVYAADNILRDGKPLDTNGSAVVAGRYRKMVEDDRSANAKRRAGDV